MTIYIFGGSNTAMIGGWADMLAMRLCRKAAVRNMGLGATNSLNALTRLMSDVELVKGDVVVWANAINDAICLGSRGYRADRFLDYVETMIRICRAHEAQFVPVLFDTFSRHLMVQQAAYAARIAQLVTHYGLSCVNIPDRVARDTGTPFIPRHHFSDVLHMVADGELCHFVAEETAIEIERGGPPPAEAEPLFLDPATTFKVISSFEPTAAREPFETDIFAAQVWRPPVATHVPLADGMRAEVEGITLIADAQRGRLDLHVDDQLIALSGTHNFPATGRDIALSVSARVVEPRGLPVRDGTRIAFDWNESGDQIVTDMYFRNPPGGRADSQARVLSLLLRLETI